MRVSLTPDNAEFVKQVADLRRNLNRLEVTKDQGDAMKARIMSSVFVPFVNVLRTELRQDAYSLGDLICAVSELMGNLAASVIQSCFDNLPADKREEFVQRVMSHAYDTTMQTFALDDLLARDAAANSNKPTLAVVKPSMAGGIDADNVVLLKPPKAVQ